MKRHGSMAPVVLACMLGVTLPDSAAAGGQLHYTKISNAGYMLPGEAQPGDGPFDWACTRDNRTGLTWEVKRPSGLRDYRHNYTWRSGSSGSGGNTASCGNSLAPRTCNTQALIDRYNAIALCGSRNWRLPLGSYRGGPWSNSPQGELAVFYGNLFETAGVSPGAWFPNTRLFLTWTGRLDPSAFGKAWLVRFDNGQVVSNFWDFAYPTMLVTPDPPRVPPGPLLRDGFESPPDFADDFDSYEATLAKGWLVGNLSEPEGEGTWTWGDDAVFPAQAGASTSQLSVGYLSTGDNGTISNWLLTPLLDFRAGSMLSFWTRTVAGAVFPDRLQVRACQGEPCNTVGPGALGVSGFTTLLLDINPQLLAGPDPTGANGYPDQWTRFMLDASDGVPQAGRGRIAFRYFVEDGGRLGSNSDYIGIDSVRIEAAPLLP